VEEDVSSYWMTLGKHEILEFEIESIRLRSLENWLWKRLWTCHMTDFTMNELKVMGRVVLVPPSQI
jgi:hypothetical protein